MYLPYRPEEPDPPQPIDRPTWSLLAACFVIGMAAGLLIHEFLVH